MSNTTRKQQRPSSRGDNLQFRPDGDPRKIARLKIKLKAAQSGKPNPRESTLEGLIVEARFAGSKELEAAFEKLLEEKRAERDKTEARKIGENLHEMLAGRKPLTDAGLEKLRLRAMKLGHQKLVSKIDTHQQKLHEKKFKLTKLEFKERLKEARKTNEKLEKEGKLLNPTKEWSAESAKSLSKALSGK